MDLGRKTAAKLRPEPKLYSFARSSACLMFGEDPIDGSDGFVLKAVRLVDFSIGSGTTGSEQFFVALGIFLLAICMLR